MPPAGTPAWDGHRAIWLCAIDLATLALVGEPALLVDGGTRPPDHPFWIEGPHLPRRDGRYYLIAAQGGTSEHHSEAVFRADALRGPYVAGPNPILPPKASIRRGPNRSPTSAMPTLSRRRRGTGGRCSSAPGPTPAAM